MPQLGPNYDMAQRVARLERALGTMLQGLGQSFSATQSDGTVGMEIVRDTANAGATVTAWFQGPNTAKDPNTGQHPPLLVIGESIVAGVPGDSAVAAYYPSGNESMIVGAGGVGIFDAAGNLVFTTDQTAGEGLGRPWLPLPIPVPAATSAWPSTNATSWGTLAYSQVVQQSPKIWWVAYVVSDSGVTGQCRLNINGGQTYSAVKPITSSATVVSDVITLPAGFAKQTPLITVEAQVTGGTGNVRVQTFGLYGRQS